MNRRVKKKGDGNRRRKTPRSPRQKKTLPERITKIIVAILAYVGLSILALSVLIFIVSTLSAWLTVTWVERHAPIGVSIEVLNGCGEKGAAKEMTSILRKKGFLVADFRNADNFDYGRTIVKVRDGELEQGVLLAEELGCDNVELEKAPDAKADVSIIIGGDWRELKLVTGEKGRREAVDAIIDFFNEFR